MLPFAIFFLLVGGGLAAFFVWAALKTRERRALSFWIFAVCFFALSVCPLLGHLFHSEKWFAVGISLPVGVLSTFLSIDNLLKYKWCTALVEAYIKELVPVYRRRGIVRYAPVFSYQYLAKNYEEQSLLHYNKRYLRRTFFKGERCEVFIDPRHPECCVDKRQRPYPDFLLLFFGLCFLAFGTIVICLPSASITVRT